MELSVNNITLYYKKEGSGPPLILIHGSGEDHAIFNKLIEKLKNSFTIYAFDSRNHGKSSKTEVFDYKVMAEDFYLAIKAMELDNSYLLGFSDGAIIGILIESEHPHTFEKMALLGVNLQPGDFKDEILQYMEDEYQKSKDPLFHMMLTQPSISEEQLASIETESLVIFAEDDLFKHEMVNMISESLPNHITKTIAGHDHGSYIVDNDMLSDELISFFNETIDK